VGDVHRLLGQRAATLAVAESLTGGLLGAALTTPSGSSATFAGGVIAYATEVKRTLLRVSPDLLAVHGAVHPEVARDMAVGVRRLLDTAYGLAVTGVAGPEPQDGIAVGTVYAAVAQVSGPDVVRSLRFDIGGGSAWSDRDRIRRRTVVLALHLLLDQLRGGEGTPEHHGDGSVQEQID
jgi:PncC family amidohydrolase